MSISKFDIPYFKNRFAEHDNNLSYSLGKSQRCEIYLSIMLIKLYQEITELFHCYFHACSTSSFQFSPQYTSVVHSFQVQYISLMMYSLE